MSELKNRLLQGLKDRLPPNFGDRLNDLVKRKPVARTEPTGLMLPDGDSEFAEDGDVAVEPPAPQDFKARAMGIVAKLTGGGQRQGPSVSRRRPVSGAIRFVVQPDGARETVWTLNKDDSVTRSTTEPSYEETLLLFSNQDFRFSVPKSVSYNKAMAMALEGLGQAVRVSNRSADLKAFYARPVENMPEYEVIPGAQAMDQALAMDPKCPSYPLIAGFLLGGEDQSQVVILYHYDDAGEVGRTQVSMNPESVDFVVAQFASTRRLDLTTIPVQVYDSAMFRRAVAGLAAFQDEDPIMGLPPLQFYARANHVATWAAAVGLLGCGFYYTKVDYAEKSADEMMASAAQVVHEREALLAASPSSLGEEFAVKGLKALESAEQLYRPGLAVQVESQPAGGVQLAVAAVIAGDAPADERSRVLSELRRLPTPAGCVKGEFQLASNLNEAKVIYKCDSQTSSLNSYRPK